MSGEKRLGRGLESLVGGEEAAKAPVEGTERQFVEIGKLTGNPLQPRKDFAKSDLLTLADSIKQQGLLQPLLVREKGERFEVIAGERRWRAAEMAGLRQLPVIVMSVDDQKMLEIALIENTQRKDLNPIEKAEAMRELMGRFNLTQELVAQRVSMDRSSVANFLRLLDLPAEIQADVSRETISPGHARALLAMPDRVAQLALAERIKKEQLSVRVVEAIVRKGGVTSKRRTAPTSDPVVRECENRLRKRFGTKVRIVNRNNQGCIIIDFYSLEDFERISKLIGI